MKKTIKACLPVLIAVALSLCCELLIFNWKAVFSIGREWTPLPSPSISGDLAEDGKLALFYFGLDRDIRWCHFDIRVLDAEGEPVKTDYIVRISDEGNKSIYIAGEISYYSGFNKASYFHLNSYGKIHDMSLEILAPGKGCSWTLRAAEINGNVPLRISTPRILGMLALFLILWLLRPRSILHDNRFWNKREWLKAVCLLLILLLNVGALSTLAFSNTTMTRIPDDPAWVHHHQYALLARALSRGETWIDSTEQSQMLELLGQMDDPYNSSARSSVFREAGINCAWDTAYFGGHLYVYFGVVPVLLTYLPYYLLTGSDLATVWVVILCGALVLISAFAFLRALIRKHFPGTPYPVYLLLSLLIGNCTGALCYAADPTFYIVPVLLSTAFAFFALALWLSAAERWSMEAESVRALLTGEECCFAPLSRVNRPASVELRIAAGALLAALVAGCRPQFLVFSFLALPIFLPPAAREHKRRVTVRRILVCLAPYLIVAGPLMYYNYVRFGSPFDFGANYNLTTNDMPLRGFKLSRLPDGFFAYLFCLPRISLRFPYVQDVSFEPVYMGKTIQEPMFGGVLFVFPFLWLLLSVRLARPVLRREKLRRMVFLPLFLALVVIAADTEMAGILWRYTADFLPLLFLPAAIVFLALSEEADDRHCGWLRYFLVLTTFFALVCCLLISMTNGNLAARSPETYYRLRDLLSIA